MRKIDVNFQLLNYLLSKTFAKVKDFRVNCQFDRLYYKESCDLVQ